MKIIINNVYSYRNRGDSAIAEAMIHYFRGRDPSAEIYLSSTFWRENKAYYHELGVESVPPLWDIPMSKNKLMRLIKAVVSFIVVFLKLCFPKKLHPKASMIRIYKESDLLIDVGGGSFFSSNKYFFYLGFYQHLFNLLAGKWLGLPVSVASQSMGPFNKRHDIHAFSRVMRKLDLVMVRESISFDLMKEQNLDCAQVPDCAFLANFIEELSEVGKVSMRRIEPSQFNVGITVLDWSWAIANRTESTCRNYLAKIADALKELNQSNMTVHLFSQTDVATERSDRVVAKELSAMLDDYNIENVVHDSENTASDLCQLYSQMDIFLGSRMHSCIFAVTQSVPVVALAYQPKTIGVLNWVCEALQVLPIDTFLSEQLTCAMRETLGERQQITKDMKERAEAMKRQCETLLDQLLLPIIGKKKS